MKTFPKVLATLGAILSAVFLLGAQPAMAASSSDAAACLESSSVCFLEGASVSDPGGLQAAVGTKLKVAVVPDDGTISVNPNGFAASVAQEAGLSDLIVVVDMPKDRFGVYSESGDTAEILTALNGANLADGGEAIQQANVESLLAGSPSSGGDFSLGGVAALVGIPLALAAAVVVSIVLLRRRKLTNNRATTKAVLDLRGLALSEDLSHELNRFSAIIKGYRGSSGALDQASQIGMSIQNHLGQLFSRIKKKGSEQSRRLADQKYQGIMAKANDLAGADYLGDIVLHPDLWNEPHQKISSVLHALKSVDSQIVDNIRQINASKELEFRVALDSLLQDERDQSKRAYGN